MRTSKTIRVIGIVVLGMVWLWLGWGFLTAKGVNLLNLIILFMTGIIIFVPLYKKYFRDNRANGK
ncbi:MAG: hypothetical protein K2N05_12435 [Muribaculaceae bacterium]|nr:hypothetical protein [Muribaculaceae bacterium]